MWPKYPYMAPEGDDGTSNSGAEGTENADNDTGEDFEARASTMGWVPKEKWNQDPDRWVDAKTYVERGETVMPVILGQKRALEAEVRRLHEEQKKTNEAVKSFQAMVQKNAEREIAAALADAKARRAEAVTNGGGEDFTAADEDVARLQAEEAAIKAKAAATTQPTGNGEHPEYQPWLAENQWYVKDEDLQLEANIIAAKLNRTQGLQGKALYEEVTKQVKARNPEKFSNRASRGNVVEGDGDRGDSRSDVRHRGVKKTYENLPLEARKACDDFIDRGWIEGKDLADKRAKYAATYDWD